MFTNSILGLNRERKCMAKGDKLGYSHAKENIKC
tara:strand:- start:9841 stop:9942 length:102 start_codon:yes stop_codon:yes gene_type:complete